MNKFTQEMKNQIEEEVCGTCFPPSYDEYAEQFDVDEMEVAEWMDEAEIFECSCCGWWLYPGDYCSLHEHDEITCTDCCEEEDE